MARLAILMLELWYNPGVQMSRRHVVCGYYLLYISNPCHSTAGLQLQ